MTFRVRVLPGAAADAAEAARWYEEQREGLGAVFGLELDEVLVRVAQRPLTAPAWRLDRTYRRAGFRRSPYSVFFTIAGDVIEIVAVGHQKRRPGAWLDR